MSVASPSTATDPYVFWTTGLPSNVMATLASEVMEVVEKRVEEYNRQYHLNQERQNDEEGGLMLIAHKWSVQSGRTPEAAIRRLYAYKNETVCISLHDADELLLALGEYIEDYDFTEFPGGKKAAWEQAELKSEDQTHAGLQAYADKVWAEAKEIIRAEYIRRGKRPEKRVRPSAD